MVKHKPYLGAIQCCPQRAHYEKTHGAWWPGWARIVDDGRGGELGVCGTHVENYIRTLTKAYELALLNDQPWIMTAQDDARPVPGLHRRLGYILAQAPEDAAVVSFFSFRWKLDQRKLEQGIRWDRVEPAGQLFAFRAELGNSALMGVRQARDLGESFISDHDDRCVGHWLKQDGLRAYTHLPSLVQHHGRVSTLGHPETVMGRTRIAVTFPEKKTINQVIEEYGL